jgi:hypothetical protein
MGITLPEARERMAKTPHPSLRPNRGGIHARSPLRVALTEGQITHGLGPVLPAKIIRFAPPPNQSYNSRHPAPMRGAYRDRHGRWVRDAMDAAASGARGVAGRASACERQASAQTTGA